MSQTAAMMRLWGAPLILALCSVIGLFAALMADGPGDWISWVALSIPVGVIFWKIGTMR